MNGRSKPAHQPPEFPEAPLHTTDPALPTVPNHNESRLEHLLENSCEAITVVDRSGQRTFVSKSVERISGWPRAAWLQRTIGSFVFEDDRQTFDDAVARAWADPAISTVAVTRSVGPDGSMRWLQTTMRNWEADPSIGGLVCNIRDVTEERDALEQALAAERRLRALIENSSDGITVRKGDSVTLLNPAAVALLTPDNQLQPETTPLTLSAEEVGRWYDAYVHPEDAERLRIAIADLAEHPGAIYISQHRIRRGEDGWRWIESVVTNHLDNPDIAGLVSNVRDITAIKEEEDRAKRHARAEAEVSRRLREALRLKAQFLAMLSHDFRTPLTSVQGYSEMIATGLLPAEEITEVATIINREANRLNGMINDMLQVERIEGGSYTSKITSCTPKEVAEHAVQGLIGTWPHRQVTVHAPTATTPVFTDCDALTLIITNLVSNALKYSPAGGPVDVRLAVTGDTLAIEVGDHGIGIPPDALDRVFDRYTRVDSAANQRIQGVGLGLAIVKHLAKLLSGDAWAESTVGVGTTMHVTVKLHDRLPQPTDGR